jgi:ribosome-binding factor A
MSVKNERIEKNIVRELSNILLMEAQNVLLKYVSVTKVKVATDLSIATVWYTIMGDDSEVLATKKALEEAKGYLRTELAQRLDLRKTPELRFKHDESLEKILEEIKKD